jgi:peptide subunit release factor 1 (eRF1)
MISPADVEGLRRRAPTPDQPVLSVYLDVDQTRAANLNGQYEVALDSCLRALEASLDHGQRAAFGTAATHARRIVASYEPHAKTLVVVTDATGDVRWTGELQIALATDARWGARPHVRPLLEAFDEHERYGVILSDKERARLFTVFLGEIEEEGETVAEGEVRHKKSSGSDHLRSQMQFQRRDDLHVQQNLRDAAGVMDAIERAHAFDRLVLAGPVEATSALVKVLPRPLADRVVGTVRLPIDATAADVLERTSEIAARVERDAEDRLVQRALDDGACGLAPVLAALQEGRVMHLLYADGIAAPGTECTGCHVLAASNGTGVCEYCGSRLDPLDDVVERAIDRAQDAGARIEQVRGDPAARLQDVGGIGALLRY